MVVYIGFRVSGIVSPQMASFQDFDFFFSESAQMGHEAHLGCWRLGV